MHREAFDRLTAAQQAVLLAAGREAVGRRITDIDRSEQAALRSICEHKLVSLVTASPEQLAALHAAVQPVYAQLERNAPTRRLIAEIREMRDEAAAGEDESLRCPGAETAVASELEGRWQATPSRAALLAAGAVPREVAPPLSGLEMELAGGKWIERGLHTKRVWTGTYSVSGDTVKLTLATCSLNPCAPGATTELGWSTYRDTLTLTQLPGRQSWWQLPNRRSWWLLTAVPFRRAG